MKSLKTVLLLISIVFVSNIYAQTVYTTKTGEKYHKNTCRYLKYSKKETTINKAKALGFAPCSVCKPTKSKTTKSNLSPSSSIKSKITSATSGSKKPITVQCTEKTKSGSRCKRKTKNANKKCYQHQ